MKKSKKPKRSGATSGKELIATDFATYMRQQSKRPDPLDATIGVKAAIKRQKQHERFTNIPKIPEEIQAAAQDLMDFVIDHKSIRRLLWVGSPARPGTFELQPKLVDICCVIIRGDRARAFADSVKEDPRWR